MKNILVCSDLSHRSDRAVRRAYQLAEAHGAALTVLSVIDADMPDALAGPLIASTLEELKSQCTIVSDRAADIKVLEGEQVGTIANYIEETKPDLVVLGSHRPRPFWDMFSGTTMERILRATSQPVLVVHNMVDKPYEKILCGIDLSPASAAAARTAVALAPKASVLTYHAIHVPYRGFVAPGENAEALNPFVNEAVAEIDAWWPEQNLPEAVAKPQPMVAGVWEALVTKRAEISPDLIAVGAHGRSTLSPTTLGSFTERLIRNPDVDVLVVRR